MTEAIIFEVFHASPDGKTLVTAGHILISIKEYAKTCEVIENRVERFKCTPLRVAEKKARKAYPGLPAYHLRELKRIELLE